MSQTRAALRWSLAALSIAVLTIAPRAAAGGRSTVGFLIGHGEPSIEDELSGVAERLRSDYAVVEVPLSAEALADVDVLIVAGHPDVPDAELYELDQFLMRGGRAAFLVDAAIVPRTSTEARVSAANVFGFLTAYGITVNPDLVLDDQCADGAVWGAVATSSSYVCWPVVYESGLLNSHPVVSGTRVIHFPWTSSITLDRSRVVDADAQVPVRSSPESWTVSAHIDVAPVPALHPPSESRDATRGDGFALAVSVEGVVGSAFPDGRVLVRQGADFKFVAPAGFLGTSEPTRLFVVGNSMMFRNDLAEQLPGNAEFLARVVNWLAADVTPSARTTGPPASAGRRVRTVAGVFLIGLLVIAASLAVPRLVIARASRKPPRENDSQGGSDPA